MAGIEDFQRLFAGSWEWVRDEGLREFFEAVGMQEEAIEFQLGSCPTVTMTVNGGKIDTQAVCKAGDGQVKYNEAGLELGVKRVVSSDDGSDVNEFCMSMDGDTTYDHITPVKPQGKAFKTSTVRVDNEMHTTYIVAVDGGQEVTGKRVFKKVA